MAIYTVAAYSPPPHRMVTLVLTIVGSVLLVGSSDTALRGVVLFVTAYAIGRASAGGRWSSS
ncbi:hypothetical protein [Planotetraspora sp. GP83]|uniref:hypothetical protein n=1 Tax=Planotetraspora sp. GP83 TaxID=3156264 RepID=UPI003513A43D